MTLRSLWLYLDYGSGACMSRAARKICDTRVDQSYESEVQRAHEILKDHIQRLCYIPDNYTTQ